MRSGARVSRGGRECNDRDEPEDDDLRSCSVKVATDFHLVYRQGRSAGLEHGPIEQPEYRERKGANGRASKSTDLHSAAVAAYLAA
jgi:hypothetical protein